MDKWDLWDRVDETAISTLLWPVLKGEKHWGLFFIPRLPIKLIFCSSCMEGFTESRGLQHGGTSTACLKMGLGRGAKRQEFATEEKKKSTIERHEHIFLASNDLPRQAVFIPVPITSPSAVVARSLTPVPVALAALRDLREFIETNHSSCPCKHSSCFHSSSPSEPVWQTAASDHKHKCTLTCTEAHSGNKSSAFLWFSCLRPKSFRVWCCASFPLCTHIYFTVLYTSTYVQWWNGTKHSHWSTQKLFKVLIYFTIRSRYLNFEYLKLVINFTFLHFAFAFVLFYASNCIHLLHLRGKYFSFSLQNVVIFGWNFLQYRI